MLEPWIIEQIRRREEEERQEQEERRPRLELPLSDERWPARNESDDDGRERERDRDRDEPKRGVVIIGLLD
jgi:hypothetical protein